MQIIEVEWQGPKSCSDISELRDNKTDFGVYCIYGNHVTSGPDTLLYIGKACDQNFATRFNQHSDWMSEECDELKIFIGRIGSTDENYTNEKWTQKISDAENLLIYYLSPPYNTSSVYKQPATEDILILNLGKRSRLPYCITSLYYQSDFYKKRDSWKYYEFKADGINSNKIDTIKIEKS